MKKILLFSVAAASVFAAHLLINNCACTNDKEGQYSKPERQRHLTKVFSNAKAQATS